ADYPNLLVEWNDDRSPDTVARGSSYKAHWKCIICGNEFDMVVKARTGQGQGCPICARTGLRRNSLRGE
ncbi:MAG: zinc-ribbon domain-containing protein, partial [Firmicutes bacterium]|nr:zinc-ribbon domain-containing protein [Bacillota bacterium]